MTARRAAPGLGLALVRGLAELHGGRAWIESEQGQGCTRLCRGLPAATRPNGAPTPPGRERRDIRKKARLAPAPFAASILNSDQTE